MIRVPIEELRPGMVLAAPIPNTIHAKLPLLSAGFAVQSATIAKLAHHGVNYVWIRHPGFEFLDERLMEALPPSRIRLFHTVKTSFSGIASQSKGSFDLTEYQTVVGEAIEDLVANGANAVWAERLLAGPEELFAHSANVTYLSLILGLSLKSYIREQRRYVSEEEADDLTNLGVGAMLHDLGKLGFDASLRSTHLCEEPRDEPTYRQHPERGYQALKGKIEATAATVVLHHHQSFDGEGFPAPKKRHRERHVEPVKGRRIHIFSRIVAVANMLDALMSVGRRRGEPTVAALSRIQADPFAPMFDPVVLRAALECIPPFPLGSRVTLSNERSVVVIDMNEGRPCEPIVQIVRPEDEAASKPPIQLDLSRPNAPRIAHDGGRPVEQYLYRITKDEEPVPATAAS